ncbi:MAG: LCP family protein [Nocardioidaceae bacterium]
MSDRAGDDVAETEPVTQRHILLRRTSLISLAVLLVLLGGTAGGYLWWADHQLTNIPRVDVGITPDPAKNHHEANHPLNILVLGADHGGVGLSVAADLADGKWTPGLHLSDTIIVLHIPADRKSAQLVSIPRDTWVKIDGYPASNGHGKLNAAFSWGGPELAFKTVQQLTGLTIDHLAIIDWEGFRDLTSALGGVKIYIPESFYDSSQRITWKRGWVTLEGDRALQYVRTRHDIPGTKQDDFGRMARQQNFMRAVMAKLLSSSTTHNPLRFTKVLASLSSYLTIDDTWDNDEIRTLAWSLRNLHTEDVAFFTAPFGSYQTIDAQDVVRLDRPQFRDLLQAISNDDVRRYAKQHPDDLLANDKSVN